jgi:hypothetical protein
MDKGKRKVRENRKDICTNDSNVVKIKLEIRGAGVPPVLLPPYQGGREKVCAVL